MNLILVSSALITVLFSVGSHASNVDRDTINWLTPNTVDASVKHPEVTEKICALLLEGAQLERELVSNRAEELSFEAMIAEARVGLNAVGRLTDKAFPQDFGQRKGPSKLIRRVRRERRQLDREVATFRRDFDARVIAALAVRSGRFRRVLNRRDRYLDYLNQLAVARRTIEVTHELIVPAEAALGRSTGVVPPPAALANRPGAGEVGGHASVLRTPRDAPVRGVGVGEERAHVIRDPDRAEDFFERGSGRLLRSSVADRDRSSQSSEAHRRASA